jgi:hypothetical protein
MQAGRAAKAKASSFTRVTADRLAVKKALDAGTVAKASNSVTHPTSVKGTLRKAGIALALAPEPITTAAGVAMVGASFAMRGREPASIATLKEETAKTLSGIKGLGADLDLLSL